MKALRSFDYPRVISMVVGGVCDLRLLISLPVLAGMTLLLAHSGLDAAVNDIARLQNKTFSLSWSAFPMLAGMVAPILVPIFLPCGWIAGLLKPR